MAIIETFKSICDRVKKLLLTPNHLLLKIELVSERLLLQPISRSYEEDIFKEFNQEVTKYMYPRPADNIFETRSFIDDSIARMKNESDLQLVILERNTREFLGCVSIHNINRKQPEFGIWLKQSVHGYGYGLEAITALKKWADKNLDYEQLIYPVDRENIPSKKIPEKLGGKSVREYHQVSLSGRVLHLIEYRIS